MSLKPSEQFHDTLIMQYKDLIHVAIMECESDARTCLHLGKLNQKLNEIIKSAKVDGLSETEITRLIDEAHSEQKDYQFEDAA